MRANEATAEFTLPQKYPTDRRGPGRWVASHAVHQWPLVIVAMLGALGNAAMAAVPPVLVGMAFNDILQSPPNTSRLGLFAVVIGITQVSAGCSSLAEISALKSLPSALNVTSAMNCILLCWGRV